MQCVRRASCRIHGRRGFNMRHAVSGAARMKGSSGTLLCVRCCTSDDLRPGCCRCMWTRGSTWASCISTAWGVKKNLQQALNYFASAAKYGHVLAQYNLAMLHLQNSGTEKCAHAATPALLYGDGLPHCAC